MKDICFKLYDKFIVVFHRLFFNLPTLPFEYLAGINISCRRHLMPIDACLRKFDFIVFSHYGRWGIKVEVKSQHTRDELFSFTSGKLNGDKLFIPFVIGCECSSSHMTNLSLNHSGRKEQKQKIYKIKNWFPLVKGGSHKLV